MHSTRYTDGDSEGKQLEGLLRTLLCVQAKERLLQKLTQLQTMRSPDDKARRAAELARQFVAVTLAQQVEQMGGWAPLVAQIADIQRRRESGELPPPTREQESWVRRNADVLVRAGRRRRWKQSLGVLRTHRHALASDKRIRRGRAVRRCTRCRAARSRAPARPGTADDPPGPSRPNHDCGPYRLGVVS